MKKTSNLDLSSISQKYLDTYPKMSEDLIPVLNYLLFID